MNIFQRTLAVLFPRSFGKMKRGYQGAVVTRLNSDWLSSQLSPDAEVRNSLRKLRDRSRELINLNSELQFLALHMEMDFNLVFQQRLRQIL